MFEHPLRNIPYGNPFSANLPPGTVGPRAASREISSSCWLGGDHTKTSGREVQRTLVYSPPAVRLLLQPYAFQSPPPYGRLTEGMKPQRECHPRINRSIAIPNLFNRGELLPSLRRDPGAVAVDSDFDAVVKVLGSLSQALRVLRGRGRVHVQGRTPHRLVIIAPRLRRR